MVGSEDISHIRQIEILPYHNALTTEAKKLNITLYTLRDKCYNKCISSSMLLGGFVTLVSAI